MDLSVLDDAHEVHFLEEDGDKVVCSTTNLLLLRTGYSLLYALIFLENEDKGIFALNSAASVLPV